MRRRRTATHRVRLVQLRFGFAPPPRIPARGDTMSSSTGCWPTCQVTSAGIGRPERP